MYCYLLINFSGVVSDPLNAA